MPDRWWTAFGDSGLNREVGQSLGGNYSLAAALQRLRAAEALTRREASDLLPDLNGFSEAEHVFRSNGPDSSLYALGLDAAYQVDLWGAIGSRVEAERLRSEATLADYHAVALTVAAEEAATWFSLIESHAQLELLNEQIDANRRMLERQEFAFGVGQIAAPDLLRQRQLVESTREQLVIVLARIDILEHQLAVLQGRPPQQARYDTGAVLPDLPPLPYTGVPADLVNRRPDVRRDYLLLQAADRDLASAVSSQYPRLNLTGSLTTIAESPGELFQDWIGTIAKELVAPLFDGGQRRAEVDRTAAVARQRLSEYGDTVLLAFREVEDALAREHYQIERIERLNAQLELASVASASLDQRLVDGAGDTDFLDVLSATTEYQRLQRATLSARLDLVLNRISLYLALAGDFDPRPCAPGGVGHAEYGSAE